MKSYQKGKKALCLIIFKKALKFTDEEIKQLKCGNGKKLKKLEEKSKNQENSSEDKKPNKERHADSEMGKSKKFSLNQGSRQYKI